MIGVIFLGVAAAFILQRYHSNKTATLHVQPKKRASAKKPDHYEHESVYVEEKNAVPKQQPLIEQTPALSSHTNDLINQGVHMFESDKEKVAFYHKMQGDRSHIKLQPPRALAQ